jgi:hypothetical protein
MQELKLDKPTYWEDGKELYLLIQKKYPKLNEEDRLRIVKGLTAAMVIYAKNNMTHKDFMDFLQRFMQVFNNKA